jgi:hypothetical protein
MFFVYDFRDCEADRITEIIIYVFLSEQLKAI